MKHLLAWGLALVVAGCGDTTSPTSAPDTADTVSRDVGVDSAAPAPDAEDDDAADVNGDAGPDVAADTTVAADPDTASEDTAGADATTGCAAAGHAVGDRYAVGDHCNYCVCQADGTAVCTARSCGSLTSGCSYGGVDHAYAATFPAGDGCDTCVCAASGLACTRRCPALPEEGAILLESLTAPCGDDPAFTGDAVLAGLPTDDVSAPFVYDHASPLYPETRPDTTVRVRIEYERGFVVCRLPAPTQPAIDMEVVVEWMTADGAFDEGFHTYLRRNNFGFVDAWLVAATAPAGGLDGDYDPHCLDPNGFSSCSPCCADDLRRCPPAA